MDEMIESLVQGTFDVVPLDYKTANNSIERLNGGTFELPSKDVMVYVEGGKIRFEVTEKIKRVQPPRPEPPQPVKMMTEIELAGIPADKVMGMRDFAKSMNLKIDSLIASLRFKDGTRLGTIKIPIKFVEVIGPMMALTKVLEASLDVRVTFKERVGKDSVYDLLGDLSKYAA